MIGDPNIGPPIGNPRNPIEILGILGLQRRSLGGPRGGGVGGSSLPLGQAKGAQWCWGEPVASHPLLQWPPWGAP